MALTLEEYAARDGLDLAKLVREGDVTPVELAKTASDAVAAVNPALNAVLEVFEDRLSDETPPPGNPDAPFYGVPYMLKDVSSPEMGRTQEMGSLMFKGNVADHDGHLNLKYQQAGLSSIGRSAVPEFGMDCNTQSRANGLTFNPWNTGVSPAGSSGGSCASVAAGVVPIGQTNDLGGSTRLPAAMCGLVGMKPTRGRTSLGPDRQDYPMGTLSEFVATRTVRDTTAVLDAVEGPGAGEIRTVVPPEGRYLELMETPPKPLRIAFWNTSGIEEPVEPEIAQAVEATAKTLDSLGHHVERAYHEFDYPEFQVHDGNITATFVADVLLASREQYPQLDFDDLEPICHDFLDRAASLSARDLMRGFERYNEMRTDIYRFFETYDILLTPTAGVSAEPLPAPNSFNRWARYCQFLIPPSVSGCPAISLPTCESSAGMPIGVQAVGRFGEDGNLLRLARQLELAMPWQDRRPAVHVSTP